MYTFHILVAASLISIALAKTDLVGCTTTDVSSPAGASVAWYVPGTGELCDPLDCGGGRAPPKTTVPGCAAYSGTLTYSPSYLPGYGSVTASPTPSTESTTTEAATTESAAETASSETPSEAPVYASSTHASSSVVETAITTPSTMSISTITSAPIAPVSGNGTVSSSTGSNGTVTNGSPSSFPAYDSGAMEVARVWVGGAGVLALGVIVASL